MAATDLRDQLQATLGDAYRIERELPPGGMSRLFLATERSLDRPVVIKVLPPEYASEVSAARFQREVTLTAHLQHPHILPIHAAGSKNGLLYYVMPYVEGESLRQRLDRQGRLPVVQAVQILREIADALARAHEAGVVHRDIKPENILLQRDHALLADFGVARALHGATGSPRLTDTGMGLGTPGYMAPEQLAGERNVDARADVYALAVVGYEMLAGEPPFAGPTPQAVAAAHFTATPKPLAQLRREVTQSVSEAIGTALATEPNARFATATMFRDALGATPKHSGDATVGRRSLIVAGLVIAVAAAAFGRWRIQRETPPTGGAPVRLAVLPFDNLGDPADAYFADGMTDAVRGKLTGVAGLEVIGSASSGQYRKTSKAPQQIGQELGARYLLTGKVRWDKHPGGASQVQVTPELLEAASAAAKWSQPFDAPLTHVFEVQADIAGKVAEELRIRLGAQDRQTLAAQPTQNLDAYDAYLRGQSIEAGGYNPAALHEAIAAFTDAVRQDSTFALAWAALSKVHSRLYFIGMPTAADAQAARDAAERALALGPNLPEAHAAMGTYYAEVRLGFSRALAEDSIGLAHAPNNVALLTSMARAEEQSGRWDAAVGHYELAERLDPQDADAASALAVVDLDLRRYSAAEGAIRRTLALRPGNLRGIDYRAMIALAQGDLAGARAVIHAMPAPIDTAALVAYLANYWDLGWLLDSAEQRVLLTLRPDAFDNSRGSWGIVLAQQYAFRGDMVRARIFADSARLGFDAELKATPDDAQRNVFRGLALAYLGRKDEAVHEADRALALLPIAMSARGGPYVQHQAARIYLVAGEKEKALDLLEPLLRIPYYLSSGWLRIDPNFAPLRGNPRFERLIAGQ